MARLPRVVLQGMPQHVIQRGTARCNIFHDDRDRRFFLACLTQASSTYRCDVHAYVLMTNHVHVLLSPRGEQGLSKMMQVVGTRYVQYFNSRYSRIGALWQGRYKASIVDSDGYFFICTRYIELNPVRAGIVRQPGEFPWSSYGHNVLGRTDPLVREHSLFDSLGHTPRDRRAAYAEMFAGVIDDRTLQMIRESANKGWALGDDEFRKRVEAATRRQAAPRRRKDL